MTPFWNETPHYTNINWQYPDQETDFYPGMDVVGEWQLGDELYKWQILDSKEDVISALKRYCFKFHQTYKVLESKPAYFTVIFLNHENGCPWRLRAMSSKKTGDRKSTRLNSSHTD